MTHWLYKSVIRPVITYDQLFQYGTIRIIWLPEHCGVGGNKKANALALKAREMQTTNLENANNFSETRSELMEWASNIHISLWNRGTIWETTRILLGNPNEYKTKV